MGPAPFLGMENPAMLQQEVQMPEMKQPPCLEEFVAAGYRAENYEKHFADLRELGEEWGPTWSNPKWTKPVQIDGLPERLQVHSTVRDPQTRVARRQTPGRKPFKTHVFSDPHKRLVRGRPVTITAQDLVEKYEELAAREKAGLLAVRTVDGKRLDLASIKDGVLSMRQRNAALTIAHPPLDSAANDQPHGIPVADYVEGTFVGDPAAERTIQRLVDEKLDEGQRQGALPADPVADAEGLEDEDFEPASQPPAPPPVAEEVVAAEDPAATRQVQRTGKPKRR